VKVNDSELRWVSGKGNEQKKKSGENERVGLRKIGVKKKEWV